MKKFIILVLLSVFAASGVFAQGTPVIDITSILQAIENGYKLYEQINMLGTQVQTTWKQLEEQVKSFEAFDITQLDAKDVLGSWGTIMKYGNRQMNYVKNIENLMNAKNMKIGNYSYSYSDFFNVNKAKNAVGMIAAEFAVFDPFANRTPEEKAVFRSKYGMDPSNYMRYYTMGDSINKKTAEIKAILEQIEAEKQKDADMLQKIGETGTESDSIVKQAQTGTALALEQINEAKKQTDILVKFAEGWFEAHQKLQIENEEREAERQKNAHAYPEGFAKMLDNLDKQEFVGGRSK